MTLHLSTEAWAALGCLAGVVLLSGAILWRAWRQGRHAQPRTHSKGKIEGPSLNRTWQKEDAQFTELAHKAEELRARLPENSTENKA